MLQSMAAQSINKGLWKNLRNVFAMVVGLVFVVVFITAFDSSRSNMPWMQSSIYVAIALGLISMFGTFPLFHIEQLLFFSRQCLVGIEPWAFIASNVLVAVVCTIVWSSIFASGLSAHQARGPRLQR